MTSLGILGVFNLTLSVSGVLTLNPGVVGVMRLTLTFTVFGVRSLDFDCDVLIFVLLSLLQILYQVSISYIKCRCIYFA